MPPYSLGVFCAARIGHETKWAETARTCGRLIAQRSWRIVYGGGGIGLMGQLADGALEANGPVKGVIPQKLIDLEQAHRLVADMTVVQTMAERKTVIMQESDDFLVLPGGIGTLDEFFEVLTAFQLGFHPGRAAILNQSGFFDTLLAMLDTMVAAGFWRAEAREALLIDTDPARLLDALARR